VTATLFLVEKPCQLKHALDVRLQRLHRDGQINIHVNSNVRSMQKL
jgi:hypothetical protein